MKMVKIVALIVIIIGAVVFLLLASGVIGGGEPEEVATRLITVVDADDFEIIEVAQRDFDRFAVEDATGYRINGDGRRLAYPTTCDSCGDLIPSAPLSDQLVGDERQAALRNYDCPKCGGPTIVMPRMR